MRVSQVSSVAVTTLAVVAAQNLANSGDTEASLGFEPITPLQTDLPQPLMMSLMSLHWLKTTADLEAIITYQFSHTVSQALVLPANAAELKLASAPPTEITLPLSVEHAVALLQPWSGIAAPESIQLVSTWPSDKGSSRPISFQAQNQPFSDVVGHWAEGEILALNARGIVAGMGDGQFHPDARITAAQFNQMLKKANLEAAIAYQDLLEHFSMPTRADAASLIYRLLQARHPFGKTKLGRLSTLQESSQTALSVSFTPAEVTSAAVKSDLLSSPGTAMPLAANHSRHSKSQARLAAGDRLRFELANFPEYSGDHIVLTNGDISLPLIGRLYLEGKTLRQATAEISRRYEPLISQPQVRLTLLVASGDNS